MRRLLQLTTAACLYGLAASSATAGMWSPLPTRWTATSEQPSGIFSFGAEDAAPFLQAISFFLAIVLVSAWIVQGLWRLLRQDLTWLPVLNYRRSLGLVVLWGLLFIVVLTMIAGARELMTPGAWRTQGWTYKLASAKPDSYASEPKSNEQIRQALEKLRQALWHYAATHAGKFPAPDHAAIDQSLWEIPGWPGQRFLYVAERHATSAGQLLVYSPELGDDERAVLMTNGMIGHMRAAEIHQDLAEITASNKRSK